MAKKVTQEPSNEQTAPARTRVVKRRTYRMEGVLREGDNIRSRLTSIEGIPLVFDSIRDAKTVKAILLKLDPNTYDSYTDWTVYETIEQAAKQTSLDE